MVLNEHLPFPFQDGTFPNEKARGAEASTFPVPIHSSSVTKVHTPRLVCSGCVPRDHQRRARVEAFVVESSWPQQKGAQTQQQSQSQSLALTVDPRALRGLRKRA